MYYLSILQILIFITTVNQNLSYQRFTSDNITPLLNVRHLNVDRFYVCVYWDYPHFILLENDADYCGTIRNIVHSCIHIKMSTKQCLMFARTDVRNLVNHKRFNDCKYIHTKDVRRIRVVTEVEDSNTNYIKLINTVVKGYKVKTCLPLLQAITRAVNSLYRRASVPRLVTNTIKISNGRLQYNYTIELSGVSGKNCSICNKCGSAVFIPDLQLDWNACIDDGDSVDCIFEKLKKLSSDRVLTNTYVQRAVSIVDSIPYKQFVLFLGDMTSFGNQNSALERFEVIVCQYFKSAPVFVILGNHDISNNNNDCFRNHCAIGMMEWFISHSNSVQTKYNSKDLVVSKLDYVAIPPADPSSLYTGTFAYYIETFDTLYLNVPEYPG